MRMLLAMALVVSVVGCTVGPKYQRPALTMPAAYRGAGTDQSSTGTTESLGDEKWSEVFQDPVLQQLIRTALQQNYDIQIAAARVLQAQAQLGITRANQFPMAAAGVEGYSERNPKIANAFPAYEANDAELDLSVIWNLDFWGNIGARRKRLAQACLPPNGATAPSSLPLYRVSLPHTSSSGSLI